MSCNKVRAKIGEPRKPKTVRTSHPDAQRIQLNSDFLRGPGSALMHINVHRYHAQQCNMCHATKREMDDNGIKWCFDNVEYLVGKLHENAQNKSWNKLLDAMAQGYSIVKGQDRFFTLRKLIVEACCKSIGEKDKQRLQNL